MQTEHTDGAGGKLGVPEVARRLGVSEQTVRNLIRDGLLPAHRKTLRTRSSYLIDLADIAAYEQSLNPTDAVSAA